jgi:hypothetical protein
MRKLPLLLILALSLPLLGTAPQAEASVVRALSLQDLVERADHVVIAVPEEKQSRRHDDGRLIVTDVSLRVKRVLKGDAKVGGVLIATRLGGKLETIALQVPGEATFEIGAEVLVFLRGIGDPADRQLRVVGMSQGVMLVERKGETPMVMPGGAHAALMQPSDSGRLEPGEPAVREPTELELLLLRISALVEAEKQAGR